MAGLYRWPPWDKSCNAVVTDSDSGYCECKGGEKKMQKEGGTKGSFDTCNDACEGKRDNTLVNSTN